MCNARCQQSTARPSCIFVLMECGLRRKSVDRIFCGSANRDIQDCNAVCKGASSTALHRRRRKVAAGAAQSSTSTYLCIVNLNIITDDLYRSGGRDDDEYERIPEMAALESTFRRLVDTFLIVIKYKKSNSLQEHEELGHKPPIIQSQRTGLRYQSQS